MVSEIVALVKLACVGALESAPETVKVKAPVAVGVPVIAPEAESESPAGSVLLARTVAKV